MASTTATATENAAPASQTLTGCVKWFNNGLNYGFITVLSDGEYRNTDVFVHQSNIRTSRDCFRTLYTGECVQFELAKSDNEKHPVHAVGVHGFNGVQLRCEVPRGRGFGGGRGRGGPRGRGRGGPRHGNGSRGGRNQQDGATADTTSPTTEPTPQANTEAPASSTTSTTVESTPVETTTTTAADASASASAPVAKGSGRGRGRGRKVSA